MNVRTRWPWISVLLTAGVALNPVGLEFIHSAFFSSEQLSRNIFQPIVLTAMAVLSLIVGLESLVKTLIIRRRARGETTA